MHIREQPPVMATDGRFINMGIFAGEPKPHISIMSALAINPKIPVGSMQENIENANLFVRVLGIG